MSVPCDCLGCRIRRAIPPVFDPNEMLAVVTKIAAEILAQARDEDAQRFCDDLMTARQTFMASGIMYPEGSA